MTISSVQISLRLRRSLYFAFWSLHCPVTIPPSRLLNQFTDPWRYEKYFWNWNAFIIIQRNLQVIAIRIVYRLDETCCVLLGKVPYASYFLIQMDSQPCISGHNIICVPYSYTFSVTQSMRSNDSLDALCILPIELSVPYAPLYYKWLVTIDPITDNMSRFIKWKYAYNDDNPSFEK